jgi:outer membrane protein TolC
MVNLLGCSYSLTIQKQAILIWIVLAVLACAQATGEEPPYPFMTLAATPFEDRSAVAALPGVRPIIAQMLEDSELKQLPDEFQFIATNPVESEQLALPWWLDNLHASDGTARQVELDELIWLAITHSPHVQSVLLEPQILDSKAAQKLGAFDPNRFVDSIFKDTSDPVGNSLVTGGPPRLNDNLWENRAGVRAKNQYGGQTEFFQEMLFKDSNSRFFTPGDQSDSKMVLQYTQPLRRGRGSAYNRSSFVIASFNATQGRYQAATSLQEHAFRITENYWNLFAARASLVQIARGLENLEQLRNRLKGRAEIDSVRSQVLRAEAAIAKQQAAMANAKAQIRSSDAILRSLVASPELRSSPEQLVPVSTVVSSLPQLDATNERTSALEHQPRVLEIQEEIKAARAKLQVAQHELQPTLNLVLQGYLRGLSGDYDVGNSLEDQFSSTPSYHAGIAYQKPKGNLAAQAIAKESRMELRRALLKLDDALLSVSANVETALAGIDSAYQQMDSAVRSTLATQAEVQYLESQWNDAFMANDSRGSLQLDQLLNAHIQLIVAENSWVSSQRDYMLALAKLQLATGKLLPAFYCNN